LFTRSGATWAQHAKLTASDGAGYGWFGCSVSLDGDTALIGAYGDDAERGSAYVFIREGVNLPPDTPIITGPATGKIKVTTNYNFTTSEPDADDVSYYIEWGDGTNSGWIGPYTSEDVITQSHNWTKKGEYMIKAKAKDINGAESNWGTFLVTMPYEPPQFPFIHWLLERFPNAFPILRYLLGCYE
jgi:lipoprotein-anchoring transpeptidase ErfK/SrfK